MGFQWFICIEVFADYCGSDVEPHPAEGVWCAFWRCCCIAGDVDDDHGGGDDDDDDDGGGGDDDDDDDGGGDDDTDNDDDDRNHDICVHCISCEASPNITTALLFQCPNITTALLF